MLFRCLRFDFSCTTVAQHKHASLPSLSVAKNCLRPENAPLNMQVLNHSINFEIFDVMISISTRGKFLNDLVNHKILGQTKLCHHPRLPSTTIQNIFTTIHHHPLTAKVYPPPPTKIQNITKVFYKKNISGKKCQFFQQFL